MSQKRISTKAWINILRVAQALFVLSLLIPVYKTMEIISIIRATKSMDTADSFPFVALGFLLIVSCIVTLDEAVQKMKAEAKNIITSYKLG